MISKTSRILIIDDEIDICFVLNHYLKSEKYKVEFSISLKEGMTKLKSFKPEILFLDISLPDGSGIDAIKNIKKSHPEIKIAIISAYDSADDISEAKNAGADSFIPKPFSRVSINATIENFLSC